MLTGTSLVSTCQQTDYFVEGTNDVLSNSLYVNSEKANMAIISIEKSIDGEMSVFANAVLMINHDGTWQQNNE